MKEAKRLMIELAPESFKWLYDLIEFGIIHGLQEEESHITEAISNELCNHPRLIERGHGNDGDYAWHGKVKLVKPFITDIMKGINLYGIIRGIIYERAASDAKRWSDTTDSKTWSDDEGE